MTYEFEYLMHLFACGARGTTPQPPRQPVNYDRLIQLAQEQSVLPLVGTAVRNAKDMGFPDDKRQNLLDMTRSMALSNYLRRRQILDLLQDFEKADIQAVLLKGYAVADLYAAPDCRISVDTDIYVDIKDEERACKLLVEHECKITPRSPISHHTVCKHPKMGYIELHIFLYDEIVENIWFDNMDGGQFIQDPLEKCEFTEGSCLVLGKTDTLIFLVLHMIKHFVFYGTNLRQIMDIALYLNKHQLKIDMKRFNGIIDTLKYRKLIDTIFSIMDKFYSISICEIMGSENASEDLVTALLDDIEIGSGLDSNKKEERYAAWHLYNRSKYLNKKSTLSYCVYMLIRNANANIHEFLSSKQTNTQKYPKLLKAIIFLPVTFAKWCYSLFVRLHKGILKRMHLNKRNIPDFSKSREKLYKMFHIM